MPDTFGPYKLTPKKVKKYIDEGVDISPSIIDVLPFQEQLDYEEIRKGIIEKYFDKKNKNRRRDPLEYPNSLWSEMG